MGTTGVYVVHYAIDNRSLTVSVDGKTVPMEEFVQKYNPVQVTSLSQESPHAEAQTFIGLIIAQGR